MGWFRDWSNKWVDHLYPSFGSPSAIPNDRMMIYEAADIRSGLRSINRGRTNLANRSASSS